MMDYFFRHAPFVKFKIQMLLADGFNQITWQRLLFSKDKIWLGNNREGYQLFWNQNVLRTFSLRSKLEELRNMVKC